MSDDDKSATIYTFAGIMVAALMALHIVIEGYVLLLLWGWFVAPLGVREISLPWAIGISCLMSLSQAAPRGKLSFPDLLSYTFFKPALLLLVGWIAKQSL